jgi:hypothetical protein
MDIGVSFFLKNIISVLWICAKLDVATSGPCSVHLTEMGTLSLLLVIVSLLLSSSSYCRCDVAFGIASYHTSVTVGVLCADAASTAAMSCCSDPSSG